MDLGAGAGDMIWVDEFDEDEEPEDFGEVEDYDDFNKFDDYEELEPEPQAVLLLVGPPGARQRLSK